MGVLAVASSHGAVDAASEADVLDVNNFFLLIDLENDAYITHSEAVAVFGVSQFFDAGGWRERRDCKPLNFFCDFLLLFPG